MKTLKAPIQALQSHLKASGYFRDVLVGEPLAPPEGLVAAIMLADYAITGTTLSGIIERRALLVRVYVKALEEARERVEFSLDEVVSKTVESLLGDFELGGGVRNIDPTGITVKFGYQTINQTMFRLADISLPLIVDDSATFAP